MSAPPTSRLAILGLAAGLLTAVDPPVPALAGDTSINRGKADAGPSRAASKTERYSG